MIGENARAWPPLVMMDRHWMSDSTVDVGQSEKSGKVSGGSKPARFCGCPLPSVPWHEAHPASQICLPVSSFSVRGGCAKTGLAPRHAHVRNKRKSRDATALDATRGGRLSHVSEIENQSQGRCSSRPQRQSRPQSGFRAVSTWV